MFCNSTRQKAFEFRFSSRGYDLSQAILCEYRNVKRLYKKSVALLSGYKKKRPESRNKSVAAIQCCLRFYDSSEKLINVLLTEILKPKANLRHKKSIFILLNKLARMFYLFDMVRFSKNQGFHDFALLKQSRTPCLSEKKTLELTSFVSISMPMAHLFISSFTSDKVELHIPTILFKRNLLHLGNNRKAVLHFVCSVLCHTEFKCLAMYLCAAYNKLFKKDDFGYFVDDLGEREFSYYRAMLLLN